MTVSSCNNSPGLMMSYILAAFSADSCHSRSYRTWMPKNIEGSSHILNYVPEKKVNAALHLLLQAQSADSLFERTGSRDALEFC